MIKEALQALLDNLNKAKQKGNYEEAEVLAKELLSSIDPSKDEDSMFHTAALRSLGFIECVRDNFTLAIDLINQAFEISEKTGDKEGIEKSYSSLGNAYWSLNNYTKALDYYARSLSIAESLHDKVGMARTYSNIGSVYLSLTDYSTAIAQYSKAMNIAKEIDNKHLIAMLLGNFGNVHLLLSDYPKAIEDYMQSIKLAKEMDNKSHLASSLGNLGTVYMYLKDYSKALQFYFEELEIAEIMQEKLHISSTLCNIGSAYMMLNEFEQSLNYSSKGIQMLIESGRELKAREIGHILGELYSNKAWVGFNAEKAEDYLLQSIEASQALESKKYDVHQSLANLYENQERWKESHYHQGLYFNLKEEVQNEEAKKQALNMDHRRKIEDAERDRQVKIARFQEQEKILHNILPAQIAERILQGEKQIADYCEGVTVFFADIVEFTNLSQKISPTELVNILNELFTEFDHLANKHGLEKIKTIGDAYMAVSGVPIAREDHAHRAASFALEVMKYIQTYRPKSFHPLKIRIGLHSGHAIAGVIGENKFAYDLWGDTVNIASRMESSGSPDKIHVSEDFMNELANTSFKFSDRGEIDIKGKGKMRTYYLEE